MLARRYGSPLAAFLGLCSAAARAERQGTAGEVAVAKALRRLFAQVANDLILPDGRGGLTQVDHLVLTPAGLLAIETKNYSGLILGSAYERTWTQVVGPQRTKFQNPLRQNHAHLEAVKALAPGVPVLGRVVFLDGASFPKGVPNGVVMLGTLHQELAALKVGTIPPPTALGWERVLRFALTGAAARQAHLDGLSERHGPSVSAAATDAVTGFPGGFGAEVRRRPEAVARSPLRRLGLAFAVLLGGLWVGAAVLNTRPSREPLSASFADHPHKQSPIATALYSGGRAPTTRPHAEPPRAPRQLAASAAVTSAPMHQVRPTSPSPWTPRSAETGQPPVARRAPLQWSEPSVSTRQSEACVLAIAAVLADNSAENRRLRERACR